MSKLAGLAQPQPQSAAPPRAAHSLQHLANPPRSLLPLLTAFFFGAVLLLSFSFYTPAYVLQIDGKEVGAVSSPEMVETTIGQVEGQIGEILGRDYHLAPPLAYRFAIAPRADLIGYTHLAQEFYDLSPEIKAAYILSVDGVEIGAAKNRAVLESALADLKAQYRTEDTRETFFANETRITRKYIPAEEAFSSRADVLAAALSPRQQEVQAQPVAAIARVYEIGEGSFLAGGDRAESTDTALGAMVSIERAVPQLSVCTVDQVRYVQEIEPPVREVPDPDRYEGDSAVLSEGSPGLLQVVADVTSLNGERLYEEVLSETVLRQAKETVLAVGTKERPKYVGSGSFQWPCTGTLTSLFGYRTIFGSTSFHGGLDIANSRGTALRAADSGIVTAATYQGTYGNMVIVDHGNGYETVYAHCESITVSVGQGVLQGEQLATMGTSGRATGSHCHFEVRIDGTKMNPQHYLP